MKKIIVAIALAFLCGNAFSQIYLPIRPTSYGEHLLRIKTDSVLHVPEKNGLTLNTSDTSAQIFYRKSDSSFYGYSRAKGYFKISGSSGVGTGSDTTALKNTFWARRLNSGTNPLFEGIGTSDSQALVLKTNGFQRMKVAANGFIGIGINDPIVDMHMFKDQNNTTAFLITNNSAGSVANSRFEAQTGVGDISLIAYGQGTTKDGVVGVYSDDAPTAMEFQTNGAPFHFRNQAGTNAKVGINIVPYQALTVFGSSYVDSGEVRVNAKFNSPSDSALMVKKGGGTIFRVSPLAGITYASQLNVSNGNFIVDNAVRVRNTFFQVYNGYLEGYQNPLKLVRSYPGISPKQGIVVTNDTLGATAGGTDSTTIDQFVVKRKSLVNNIEVDIFKVRMDGRVTIVDGNQGNGKVLTSDASGNASWQTPSGGGGGSTNTSVGSGYRIGINGTNNIKSLTATNGLTADSATTNQVGIKLGGNLTGNTTVNGVGAYNFNIQSTNTTSIEAAGFVNSIITVASNFGQNLWTSRDGRESRIKIQTDSLAFFPSLGNFYIDSLNYSNDPADSMIVWRKSGSGAGMIGMRKVPTSGTGTVTSIATNTGSGITGGTITGSGTISADTTLLATRLKMRQEIHDSLSALPSIQIPTTGTPVATVSGTNVKLVSIINSSKITATPTSDSTITLNLVNDTTTQVTFNVGAGNAADTLSFNTSAIYGNTYIRDTLVITSIIVYLQGASSNVTVKLFFNDSLGVTAGATAINTAGNACTNTTTGTVITSFNNSKVPPGVTLWCTTSAVATKPTMMSVNIIGYRKKSY